MIVVAVAVAVVGSWAPAACNFIVEVGGREGGRRRERGVLCPVAFIFGPLPTISPETCIAGELRGGVEGDSIRTLQLAYDS